MAKKVIYWMSRALRVQDNPALIHAQQYALTHDAQLEVHFYVLTAFPFANARNMSFLLQGLLEVSTSLKDYRIPLEVHVSSAAEDFEKRLDEAVIAVFTEHAVLRFPREQQAQVNQLCLSKGIPFKRISTATVVPVNLASPKLEFAARTFRPKIMGQYKTFLKPLTPLVVHPTNANDFISFDEAQYESIYAHFKSIAPFPTMLVPGEKAALAQLDHFIQTGLPHYDQRNDISAQATSHLSAYLHFGMLSPRLMIEKVEASGHPNAALFVEEAMVRRELAENYCYYQSKYDSLEGAWDWAKETLKSHEADPRPHLYDFATLENAQTDDPLWNHCQRCVLEEGYLHGYLRMYWAKQVLKWTPDAQSAIEFLIRLNDTYFLDGRDPNGYTGILWSIAGVHDRPWFNQPIFGLVRLMGSDGTLKKSKLKLQEK